MERTLIITEALLFEGLELLRNEAQYKDIYRLIDKKSIKQYIKKNKLPLDIKLHFIIIMSQNNPYYINKENKIFKYNEPLPNGDKYPYGDIIVVYRDEMDWHIRCNCSF